MGPFPCPCLQEFSGGPLSAPLSPGNFFMYFIQEDWREGLSNGSTLQWQCATIGRYDLACKATARKAPGLSYLAAENKDLSSFLLLHCYFQFIGLAQANFPLTLRIAAVYLFLSVSIFHMGRRKSIATLINQLRCVLGEGQTPLWS